MFLIIIAWLTVLVMPAVSAAQMSVGVIIPANVPYYQEIHNALSAKIQKAGYGQKIEFVIQRPSAEQMSLTNAARKLIAYDVSAIIAYGAPAALAVVGEMSQTPLVYAGVYDPLAAQIRGKNVTGISAKITVSSLLRYLRAVAPITTLGVVYSSTEAESLSQMKELAKLAEQYKIRLEGINLLKQQDAKKLLSGKKVDTLFLTGSSVCTSAAPAIMDFAGNNRIPVGSFMLNHASSSVVSLSVSAREQGEKAADKVMKLAEGVSADKLRTETSNEIELVFNMKEAGSLGCRIPMELVTEATRLIK